MSVAVCRGSFSPFESILMANIAREPLPISPANWLPPAEQYKPIETPVEANKDDDRPGQFDIWSSIQSQKAKETAANLPAPYVHPLVRRSSSLMSQKSLEICTESLGSETGSADFSSLLDALDCFSSNIEAEEEEHNQPIDDALMAEEEVPRSRVAKGVAERQVQADRKELVSVNYHCSINRRSPPRSFPPPLPSISRRDGPCIHMRPHRRDGRLVVEAVPVPSQNYLHAQRQDGRLLLTFIDATFSEPDDPETDPSDTLEIAQKQKEDAFDPSEAKEEEEKEAISMAQIEEGELEEENNCDEEEEEEAEEEEEEEEVEEEVEVVDRGTVVEVKVSTQPQQQSGAMKVQRSSFVINKFVGAGETRWAEKMAECKPTAPDEEEIQQDHHSTATAAPARRAAPTTTTAAAAAAAASTFSTSSEDYRCYHLLRGPQLAPPDDNKLLFTSRNREELLHHIRRCSQLRRPLFILERCCIATST